MWEYRDGYRDQIFLISACIQNHMDCDFVGVRMVTFLFGMGVEWLGEKHEYFVLNVVVSVMCLVCVLFHGSLYPFYEMFFLSCIYM